MPALVSAGELRSLGRCLRAGHVRVFALDGLIDGDGRLLGGLSCGVCREGSECWLGSAASSQGGTACDLLLEAGAQRVSQGWLEHGAGVGGVGRNEDLVMVMVMRMSWKTWKKVKAHQSDECCRYGVDQWKPSSQTLHSAVPRCQLRSAFSPWLGMSLFCLSMGPCRALAAPPPPPPCAPLGRSATKQEDLARTRQTCSSGALAPPTASFRHPSQGPRRCQVSGSPSSGGFVGLTSIQLHLSLPRIGRVLGPQRLPHLKRSKAAHAHAQAQL